MPPEIFAKAVPLHWPKQLISGDTIFKLKLEGFVRIAVAVTVHKFASVTVTKYAPAVRFIAVADVCTGVVFHA